MENILSLFSFLELLNISIEMNLLYSLQFRRKFSVCINLIKLSLITPQAQLIKHNLFQMLTPSFQSLATFEYRILLAHCLFGINHESTNDILAAG